MARLTLERFNPDALSEPPTYSYAVRAKGDISVFSAGAVPLDRHGDLVGDNDPAVQAAKVLENLTVAIETAGATLDDVVKITTYVASSEGAVLEQVWAVIETSPIARAASTMVGVGRLYYEGQLVEIEAIAVL